eukprot:gene628-619_t
MSLVKHGNRLERSAERKKDARRKRRDSGSTADTESGEEGKTGGAGSYSKGMDINDLQDDKVAVRQARSNGGGETNLHRAAMGKDLRIKGRRADREWTIDEVFKLMKGKSDAYLLKKDDSENTCVHITCMEGGAAARAILKEWRVRGLPLDLTGNCGNTPLIFASMTNQVGVGRMLIRAGCRLDLANGYGTTALHRAIGNGSDQFVAMLIHLGADVEDRNFDGLTPLHLAGMHSAGSRAGELLIDAGADQMALSPSNKRPEDYVMCSSPHGAAVFRGALRRYNSPWSMAEHRWQPWKARLGVMGLLMVWQRLAIAAANAPPLPPLFTSPEDANAGVPPSNISGGSSKAAGGSPPQPHLFYLPYEIWIVVISHLTGKDLQHRADQIFGDEEKWNGEAILNRDPLTADTFEAGKGKGKGKRKGKGKETVSLFDADEASVGSGGDREGGADGGGGGGSRGGNAAGVPEWIRMAREAGDRDRSKVGWRERYGDEENLFYPTWKKPSSSTLPQSAGAADTSADIAEGGGAGAGAATDAGAVVDTAVKPTGSAGHAAALAQLQAMGFERHLAESALLATNGSVERSLTQLLS